MTTRQYKDLKDLKKENLRDNMTTLELVLIGSNASTCGRLRREAGSAL